MTDVIGSASIEVRAKLDRLNADARRAERDMKASVGRIERDYVQGGKRSTDAWGRSQRRMVQETKRAEAEIRASSGRIQSAVSGAAGALAVAAGTGALIQLSDAYTRFSNSLKVAGLEGQNLGAVQEQLFAIAIQNGVEVEALGSLYSRAAQSAGELGATQGQLVQFSQGVSAALRIQGASAGAASGALTQLSQALAAGTVRAEEFQSINDGARPILEAVAQGSDRFGGSVAKLRAEVYAGTVTSKEFFDAFLRGSADLEAKAGKATLTVAQGFINLQTALIQYVGESKAAQATTAVLANAIDLMAKNLDILIPSIAAITVGIGTAYVGGTIAASAATLRFSAALGVLNGAMTLISRHPIIAVLTVIAAGLAFVAVRGGEASAAMREIDAAADGAKTALDAYEEAARAAANAAGDNAKAAAENAARMREEAKAALDSARALYARRVALAADAAALARQADRNASRGISNPYAPGFESGRASAASTQAAAEEKAARDAMLAAGIRFSEIENSIRQGGYRVTPSQSAGGPARGGGAAMASEARTKAIKPVEMKLRELLADIEADRAEEFSDLIDGIRSALGGNDLAKVKGRARGVQEAAAEAAEATDRAYQEMRDNFRSAFSDGVRAALDGDLAGLFESLADRFTDRMIGNLADNLFDMLSSSGSGFFGTALSAIFGGARAFGGPVQMGKAYKVGERGPEYFVPPGDGQIVPKSGIASRASTQPGRTLHFDLRGAVMTADLLAQMERMSAESGGAVLNAARAVIPAEQARKRRYGYG
jgi:tape measure domain-containing protein